MSLITLTTDFGEADHYVACMKGAILQQHPTAQIIDVTHKIMPHDIIHGAFVLRQVFEFFPADSIHVAIVDPGVGTARRILVAKYSNQTIIVPDNGLLTFVHRDFQLEELRVISNNRLFRAEVSHTFHGRDIVAPVAGMLAQGLRAESVGPLVNQLELLNIEPPKTLPQGGVEGQVLYIDHFGNVITNISADDLETVGAFRRHYNVHVGPLRVGPLHETYADAQPGQAVAVIGSTGMLEVAINQGNAAAQFRASPGTIIVVR